MDRVIKNYEEPLFKRMSGKEYLRYLRHKREVNKQNKKSQKHYEVMHGSQPPQGHVHGDTGYSHAPQAPQGINVVPVAVIVDDVVVEIMRVQEEFGKLLLENPKFIILNAEEYPNPPQIGFLYRDEKFVTLEDYVKESRPTFRG